MALKAIVSSESISTCLSTRQDRWRPNIGSVEMVILG